MRAPLVCPVCAAVSIPVCLASSRFRRDLGTEFSLFGRVLRVSVGVLDAGEECCAQSQTVAIVVVCVVDGSDAFGVINCRCRNQILVKRQNIVSFPRSFCSSNVKVPWGSMQAGNRLL